MKIRNLELRSRVFLAPMLEPNDVAFRLLCKRAGCGLTWTGMTSALSRAKIDLDDLPVLQLFGNSCDGIEAFMKRYDSEVSGWDFNLGCPSKLSRRLEHGAFMAEDLERVEEILRLMRGCTEKFLCVKIRKSGNGVELARLAEVCGVDAVCVHARTAGQGYSGEVDYDWALEVKRSLGVPVIFSGVSRLEDVEKILRDFDFVMLGRLAIGKPGVFAMVNGEGGEVKNEPRDSHGISTRFGKYLELAERFGLYFRQVKYQAMNWTKGLRGGAELRRRLVECGSVGDIERIIRKS
jgi:tRNA-dihydrouridine synthase B